MWSFWKNLQQCLMMMSKTSFWSKLARVFGRLNCPLQAEEIENGFLQSFRLLNHTFLLLWRCCESAASGCIEPRKISIFMLSMPWLLLLVCLEKPVISSHLLENQGRPDKKKCLAAAEVVLVHIYGITYHHTSTATPNTEQKHLHT